MTANYQSNYSSLISFSYVIPVVFGPTGNSVIRSADSENPTEEPNMGLIGGDPLRRYRHSKCSK